MIRKLSFKVARPQNPDAFREIDPSAEYAIDLLNEHGGLLVDINISVGKRRRASLSRDTVLRVVRGLFGHRGEEVRKVTVSGRADDDASIEMIDLFEDRLIYEAPAEYRGRAIDPQACERILLAAHEQHAQYLPELSAPRMNRHYIGKRFEIAWPWIFGIAAAVAGLYFHARLILPLDAKARLLDKLVNFCSIGVGFWATALALLLALEGRETVEGLKKLDVYGRIVTYFLLSVYSFFALLLLCCSFQSPWVVRIGSRIVSSLLYGHSFSSSPAHQC